MPLKYTLCLFVAIQIIHLYFFFFFNDTATTEIYTLSLHDALPIFEADIRGVRITVSGLVRGNVIASNRLKITTTGRDRKSTRLNSSHSQISYAVFCLKKKKKKKLPKCHRTVSNTHSH